MFSMLKNDYVDLMIEKEVFLIPPQKTIQSGDIGL